MSENEIPVINCLKFKDAMYRSAMGYTLAFVTCIDIQSHGKGTGEKHYWGFVTHQGNVDGLTNIIKSGAKWDPSEEGEILL